MDKKRCFCYFTLLILMVFISGCKTGNKNVTKTETGIKIRTETEVIEIQVVDANIIRIVSTLDDSINLSKSLMIVDELNSIAKFKVKHKKGRINLSTEKLTVSLDPVNGEMVFRDSTGYPILQTGLRSFQPCGIRDESGLSIRQDFHWKDREALFGLGQHQDGIMNWRGRRVDLWQSNMVAVVPVLVSSEGYGILWDNYSYTTFSDDSSGSYLASEVADGIDYYFLYGPEPDQVIAGYRHLTGTAPLFPKWAYGYIQSRERYKSQEQVIGIVKEYRDRRIPLDVIVQDWQYWKGDQWGQKSFNPEQFPDPAGMMKQLHEIYHAHLMISVWPRMASHSSDFIEMKEKTGYLYEPDSSQSFYDAFNPGARNLYWKQADQGLFKYGIDAWWCDATEPELQGWNWDPDQYRNHMKPAIGSGTRYMNAYSLMQAKGIYENQRKTNSDKRVFNLTRSAYAGQQRFGAATWSGDVDATWESFRNQISAGLNFSISGIPYWTNDIGAFFVYGIENWTMDRHVPEKITDNNYKDLYVRWFQFGAFCPLFRSHGTDLPREIWKFGEPGDYHYDILVNYDQLRYRLFPYIYSLAGMVTHHDYTIMRPLVMDFRNDPEVFNIDNQYMFGPSIMVCPVTQPGVKEWEVYLPVNKGGWYDFWTGQFFEGGQVISIPVTIETMPLFVKGGSVIPMGRFMEYATEKVADPIELRIYPGNNCKFIYYEDENDGYNYEENVFSEIEIAWSNEDSLLTLGNRRGSYPGMLDQITFNSIVVSENHGTGLLIEKKPDKSIVWLGEEVNSEISSKSSKKFTFPTEWSGSEPTEVPVGKSTDISKVLFTGRHAEYTGADTWYPSWATNDVLYSPWTDGNIEDHHISSGGRDKAETGHAKILGTDPLNLSIVNLGSAKGSALPYGGRYPCGTLIHDGIWYYGTYCLDNIDKDGINLFRKWGFNWGVLGPFVGFRISEDFGVTWTDCPHTPASPLFPEPKMNGGPVKIGAPHFVDFGKNMEHSPDGMAYLIGHGAISDDPDPRPANLSWISGDQIYLCRVKASPENINNEESYEYYAGVSGSGDAIWSEHFEEMKPVFEWNNHCGCVTMTYNKPLDKYLMIITDGWPTTKKMDTYILESDNITGPWSMVEYLDDFGEQGYFVNIPSKFISEDGKTMWLCYSANFTNHYLFTNWRSYPPGSKYALCLQEIRIELTEK